MLAPLVRASATRLALGAARPPAARRLPSLAAAFWRPSSSTSPLFGSSSSSTCGSGSSRHAHMLSPSTVTVRQHSKPPQATATAAATADAFADLPLSQSLLAAVAERGLERPTEIQAVAVPALVNDRTSDFLLASHTGSGKTLAYLLPIVQLLKEAEELGSPPAKPRRPRALVLGPTRELTDQILAVAKTLSHHAKFRSAVLNGGGDWTQQKAALERSVDLLVATPQRLMQHNEKGNLFYGDVEVVVLDEADTMFDRGFGPEVRAVLKAVRSKTMPARCVLVSATMSKQVRRLIEEDFPSVRKLETSTLHRGVAGARHSFLPMPPGSNKLDILLQVAEGEQRRGRRVMVFCNTLDSCRAADHHLRERGLPTACYHGDVPLEGRRAAIAAFSAAAEGGSDSDGWERGGGGEQRAGLPLLVCTDLAARGLDIPGRVDHVINFDFPLNPIDYLHRTGRTARAGASGRITSLVAKGDRVLAARIEEALARGLPLDALSADRRVLPPHMRPKPETLQRKAAERKAAKHSARGVRGAARLPSAAGSGGSLGSKGSKGSSPGGRKASGKKHSFTKFK